MTRRKYLVAFTLVLGAGALAGPLSVELAAGKAPRPRAEPVSRYLPSYPGAVFLPITEELWLDEWPRALAYSVVDDPPRKVVDHYDALFRARGLVALRGEVAGASSLSVSDGERQLSVVALAEGRGTVLLASVSDGERGEEPSPASGRHPSACRAELRAGAREHASALEVATWVCAGTVLDVAASLDALYGDLKRRGELTLAGGSLEYSGPGREVQLSLRQVSYDPAEVLVDVRSQELP